VNAKHLLARLLEITQGSEEYFVSGSLSFLPLLGNYRAPEHDVDAAIARESFDRRRSRLAPGERVRFLRLAEVAVAGASPLAQFFSPRTSFTHLETPDGLLDLACYRRGARGFVFSLGAGITLELPDLVRGRFRRLSWDGLEYQAGPPELAFLPKAGWYLWAESGRCPLPDAKTLGDLRRLQEIVDWDFVHELLEKGGARWLGRRLPSVLRRLDPSTYVDVMSLRGRAIN